MIPHLNSYLAFYKKTDVEVYAPTVDAAQRQAVKALNLHATQFWRIKVMIMQRGVTTEQLAQDEAVIKAAQYYYSWQSPESAH